MARNDAKDLTREESTQRAQPLHGTRHGIDGAAVETSGNEDPIAAGDGVNDGCRNSRRTIEYYEIITIKHVLPMQVFTKLKSRLGARVHEEARLQVKVVGVELICRDYRIDLGHTVHVNDE